MTWELAFTPRAERDFSKLPRHIQRRFSRTFDDLRTDPVRPRPKIDIKRLSDAEQVYRLRIGRFRGFYELYFIALGKRIVFTRFEHRKRAYR